MNFQQLSSFEQIVFIIIIVNVAVSLMAFGNIRTFEKLKFHVGEIIGNKEYHRILTSAFVHGGYIHLFFNMYVLYIFGGVLGNFIGILEFIFIYFTSLFIGNLVPLLINRNKPNYSAVGASGAVSGVLYASIYLVPTGISINFVPAWLFGILYLIYSIYSSKKNNDNIGHDAHLAGSITGLLIIFILKPEYLELNWMYLVGMLVPILYYVYNIFSENKSIFKTIKTERNSNYSNRKIDDLYNNDRTLQIRELNSLLDKVKEKGLDKLSIKERERLDQLSEKLK